MTDNTMPHAVDPRTRLLLEAPIGRTLLKLAAPNVVVMVAQAAVGLVETFFVGKLGTDALAGMALVFPIVMLMQMTSAGAMGGGIASSIARALGGGRREDADSLVLHAMVIALGFGVAFSLVLLLGGRWLYAEMGGSGASLEAAVTYSHWVFAGSILVWLFNSLAAVIRGTGNMTVPANVTVVGVMALIPLSPMLIFGWGPIPALGIAGGAIALLLYYLVGTLALAAYLWSDRSLLKPSLKNVKLRWPLFRDILRIGLVGSISTLATNLSIGIATSLAGGFGPAAIAGYGTASRLEYLLVPLVFGLGAPLVAMVGTCMGAGQHERALKATWIGAAMAFTLTEAIGLAAAFFPHAWLSLFGSDPAMIEAGTLYLRAVGPLYGSFGVGLVLYFASQGAGRLLWPVAGNIARLLVAGIGGWLAIRWGGNLWHVFMAQGAALVVYGIVIAAAIAGGAWFGRVGWPVSTGAIAASHSNRLISNKGLPMRIKDSVIFITGANRGLGLAYARGALAAGARKVYAAARDPASITLPGVIPVALDVTNAAQIAAAVAACGDVTLLINNAGISRSSGFLSDAGVEAAKAEFETNFFGPWALSQAFAPVLAANGGGAIVNVLSALSWLSYPAIGTYSASKSAAWSLTNGLRHELRAQGTQVVGLHVAFMDTDMAKNAPGEKTQPDAVVQQTWAALEAGASEILADGVTRQVKQGLSLPHGAYLGEPYTV